jgi:hypothetical protein
MKTLRLLGILFVVLSFMMGDVMATDRSNACVRVKLGEKWVSSQQMEETAAKYLKGKDDFTGKDVEVNIWVEVVDAKQIVRVAYSSGIGKRHWLVTLGENGKVIAYTTEIAGEGRRK